MSNNDIAETSWEKKRNADRDALLDELRASATPKEPEAQEAPEMPAQSVPAPKGTDAPKTQPAPASDAETSDNVDPDQRYLLNDAASAIGDFFSNPANNPNMLRDRAGNFLIENSGAIVSDAGTGLVEMFPNTLNNEDGKWEPGQLIGAAGDFFNSVSELGAAGDTYMASKLPYWPALDGSNMSTMENLEDRENPLRVPKVQAADSVTGSFGRGLAQFAIGFKGADKALGAGLQSMKAGTITSGMAKGAFADFIAFDPEEGRLADMVNAIPDDHAAAPLKQLVPEFLVSKGNDGEVLGRIKNVVEGGVLGVPFEFLGKALTATKKVKRAKEEVQTVIEAIESVETGVSTRDELMLNEIDELLGREESIPEVGPTDAQLNKIDAESGEPVQPQPREIDIEPEELDEAEFLDEMAEIDRQVIAPVERGDLPSVTTRSPADRPVETPESDDGIFDYNRSDEPYTPLVVAEDKKTLEAIEGVFDTDGKNQFTKTLNALTVKELKAISAEYGGRKTGNKQSLIMAITNHVSARKAEPAEQAAPTAEVTPQAADEVDLDGFSESQQEAARAMMAEADQLAPSASRWVTQIDSFKGPVEDFKVMVDRLKKASVDEVREVYARVLKKDAKSISRPKAVDEIIRKYANHQVQDHFDAIAKGVFTKRGEPEAKTIERQNSPEQQAEEGAFAAFETVLDDVDLQFEIADEIGVQPRALKEALNNLLDGDPDELGAQIATAYKKIRAGGELPDPDDVPARAQTDEDKLINEIDEVSNPDGLDVPERDPNDGGYMYSVAAKAEDDILLLTQRVDPDAETISGSPGSLVLKPGQRVFSPGRVDDAGFITSAERALANPSKRFRSAKNMTAAQWRKMLEAAGATGDAFKEQVEPALELIGRGKNEKITKEELTEAMARSRPAVLSQRNNNVAETIADTEFALAGPLEVLPSPVLKRMAAFIGETAGVIERNTSANKISDAMRRAQSRLDGNFLRLDAYSSDDLDLKDVRLRENNRPVEVLNAGEEQDYSFYVSEGKVEAGSYEQEILILPPDKTGGYRSHNWEAEGVIGHVRSTVRETSSGERVLYGEEIQSDIQQERAKEDAAEVKANEARIAESGAQRDQLARRREEIDTEIDEIQEVLDTFPDDDPAIPQALEDFEKLSTELTFLDDMISDIDEESWLVEQNGGLGIPDVSPIRKWEKPFIRRLLQRAEREGVDRLVMPVGDALNKAVRSEGTSAFYNNILPAHMKKVAKELGGKFEQVEVDFGEDIGVRKVPSILMTPEAKAKLAEGNVMFSKSVAGSDGNLALSSNARVSRAKRRTLRKAARRAMGKSYEALERAGRVVYADDLSQIIPGIDESDNPVLAVATRDRERVTINASKVTPEQMPGIILHEVGIHTGLRDFIGEEGFNSILNEVERLSDLGLAGFSEAYQHAVFAGRSHGGALKDAVRGAENIEETAAAARQIARDRAARPEDIREESLAYLVQNSPRNSVTRKIVAMLKIAIAKKFPDMIGKLRWQEGDFRQLALASIKRAGDDAGQMPVTMRAGAEADGTHIVLDTPVQPGDIRGNSIFGERVPETVTLSNTVEPVFLKSGNLPDTVRSMETRFRSPRIMEAIHYFRGGEGLFEYGDILDSIVRGEPTPEQMTRLQELLLPLKDMDLPLDFRPSRTTASEQIRGSERYDFPGLSPNEQKAAEMRRNGYTTSEIADELETTPASVEVSLSRARKKGAEIPTAKELPQGEGAQGMARRLREDNPEMSADDIADRIRSALGTKTTAKGVNVMLSRERDLVRAGGETPLFSRGDDTGRKSDLFDPYAAPRPYLNLRRIKGTDDFKQLIRELADNAALEAHYAVGPRETLESVKRKAASEDAFRALEKSRNGDALQPAEALALRMMRDTSADSIREIAMRHSIAPTDATRFALQQALILHRAIQAEVSGASANASRALGSLRILSGTSSARRRQVEDAISRFGTDENMDSLIKKINKLSEDQDVELDALIKKSAIERFSDASGAWMRSMMLSNPKTHIVNLTGNAAIIGYDIAGHFTSGALARVMGDPVGAKMMAEAVQKGKGVLDGIAHQFQYMKANSQLNPSEPAPTLKFDDRGVSGHQIDTEVNRPISAANAGLDEAGPLGQAIEFMGYGVNMFTASLGTADDFFKGINYMGEIRAQAHRRASTELRGGAIDKAQFKQRMEELVEFPTEEMIRTSRLAAKERTFTSDPGPATMSVLGLRRKMNGLGLPIGHYLLPFVITPSNIMSYTFKSLPMTNMLFDDVREAIARGGPDAWRARGQVAMGTTTLALAWQLANEGMISGGGPTDPQKRQAMQSNEGIGWVPYSVKMPWGNVAYDRFDPIGNLLTIGAELSELTSNRDMNSDPDDDLITVIAASAMQIGKSMLDKSYLTGVRDFFAVASDPDRYAKSYIEKAISAFTTPAIGAEVRRQHDPVWRETHNIVTTIKNRLPGQSDALPMEYDTFGRPKTYQSGLGRVYDSFSPFITRAVDPTPIDSEVQRLGYWPTPLSRSIGANYGGQPVQVSLKHRPEIYSRMSELMGGDEKYGLPPVLEGLNELVKDPGYQQLSDGPEPLFGTKAYMIRAQIDSHKAIVRSIIASEFNTELTDLARREVERATAEADRQAQERAAKMLEEAVVAAQ